MSFKDSNGDLALGKVFRAAVLGVAGLAVVGAGFGSFFVTNEGEVDMVKTMGKLDESKVYTAGPHLKYPFADSVVTFSLAPRQKTYEKLDTNTGDNQPIIGTIKVTYNVPVDAVPRLIRDPNWESRIEPQAVSSFKEVMGKQDAVKIAIDRSEINRALTVALKASLKREVGIDVTNVQLFNYDLKPDFMATINEVAKSKAMGEKLKQDKVNMITAQETAKVKADGEAAAELSKTQGAANGIRATADAEAYAIKLNGQAKADAMKTQLSAVGDPKILVDLANAEAWKSGGAKMPETLVTGGNSSTLLVPAAKAAVAATVAPAPKP